MKNLHSITQIKRSFFWLDMGQFDSRYNTISPKKRQNIMKKAVPS